MVGELSLFIHILQAILFVIWPLTCQGRKGATYNSVWKRFGLLNFDPQQSVHHTVAGKIF